MHQDGHGTVDSEHSCLSGYSEVIMLRRLPECHKRKAHNILFRLPTDDGRKDKLLWPESATIESWKQLGYVAHRIDTLRKALSHALWFLLQLLSFRIYFKTRTASYYQQRTPSCFSRSDI
jgi:hypothetical protein